MQLGENLSKAQEFVGTDELTNYKVVWLQETKEAEIEVGFIEEPDEDEVAEDGFTSLYNLIIAIAEYTTPPRLVKIVHKQTGKEHTIFKRNN